MANGIMYHVQVTNGVKKWGVDWKDSLQFLTCKTHMTDLAKGYRYYINKYVPKKSGRLRRSARPKGTTDGAASGSARVYWGQTSKTEKYAHYQFVGDVYSPSKPVFLKNGKQVGWVSPKGNKKVPANPSRKLGEGTPYTYTVHTGLVKTPMGYKLVKGDFEVTVKGYTTKGTGYNWIQRFHDDNGDFGEKAINIRAGRYMYEKFCNELHKHDKSVRARGGYSILRSWNQIKNRVD